MKNYAETEWKNIEALAGKYREFLDLGKTERECVKNIVAIARENGYRDLEEILGGISYRFPASGSETESIV